YALSNSASSPKCESGHSTSATFRGSKHESELTVVAHTPFRRRPLKRSFETADDLPQPARSSELRALAVLLHRPPSSLPGGRERPDEGRKSCQPVPFLASPPRSALERRATHRIRWEGGGMRAARGSSRTGRQPLPPTSQAGGYVPLRDYAVIGDGRTAALISRTGSVDWLSVPDLDSPAVFGAVLDAGRGGCCVLEPEVPYRTQRRYLPGTNVLETTFLTTRGTVRITDALTLRDDEALSPARELVRRLDGVSGSVPLRWSVHPRFDYGAGRTRFSSRSGVPVATTGEDALAVCSWGAGAPECD